MSDQQQSEKLSRRAFLKSAAVAGGAATVTTLGSQVQASAEDQSPAEQQASPTRGYRETPHIRQYYDKARF